MTVFDDEVVAANLILITEFGVPVTISPPLAPDYDITAVFDNEYEDPLNVESTSPALTCQTVDLASPAHGDALVVSGNSYTVRSVKPDGTGITVLILEAV